MESIKARIESGPNVINSIDTSYGTNIYSSRNGMHSNQLLQLFEEELREIYWTENALIKLIPKMIRKASSEELIVAMENHLTETEEQLSRVEQVFEILNKKAVVKICEPMEGLINEIEELIADCEEGSRCDAAIISAGQKVEYYEIASYGILCQLAETLGFEDAEDLLQLTLDEEKSADEKLTEVAISAVNVKAYEEFAEEEMELETISSRYLTF